MRELTDLSICNIIAEIEEIPHWQHLGKVVLRAPWSWDNEALEAHIYNPLTDDALCFQLMVKYKLCIDSVPDGLSIKLGMYDDSYVVVDESPNRAICLAIIEANSNG